MQWKEKKVIVDNLDGIFGNQDFQLTFLVIVVFFVAYSVRTGFGGGGDA